jgi:DNA-binding GntR family transcriptional regulator
MAGMLQLDRMPPLAPAETKSAQVRERIRELIESGRLEPGDRVNVDAIARAVGVSKIPVREAISQLEALGLVVVTPHAGARVATRSAHDLRGIYLVRASLEPLAARLAAESIDAAQLESLEALAAQMETAFGEGTLDVLSDANRAFHAGIARASGYAPVAEMVEEALRRVAPYRSRFRPGARRWASVLAEHRVILGALRARDGAAAEASARAHVEQRLAGELDEEASA